MKITPAVVLKHLSYDPATGVFTWIAPRATNVKHGQIAGSLRCDGYVNINLYEQRFSAHRLAWFVTYGEWPQGQLDHIDSCRSNNAISNLRILGHAANVQRGKRTVPNKTGFRGVSYEDNGKWPHYRANIEVNGRRIRVGSFKTAEEASAAYEAAKLKYHEA